MGKIICVVNEEYGFSEDLPFDIKHRRLLGYNISNKDKKMKREK